MKRIILAITMASFLLACNNEKKDETSAASTADSAATAEKPVVELLPPATADIVKTANEAFSKGDMDGFVAGMDDNIMFRFSGGDSLVGKQAVKDYFTARRNLIETITFSNDILLPVMANQSPNGGATPAGKWLLAWHQADVKYKNGKALTFWFHVTQHINDAGKADLMTQFIDRAPIIAASK